MNFHVGCCECIEHNTIAGVDDSETIVVAPKCKLVVGGEKFEAAKVQNSMNIATYQAHVACIVNFCPAL